MKKRNKARKLSLKKDERKALIKSLARAFFLKEKIKTTLAKAKEIQPFVEKILTKARKGDLSSRRSLIKYFSSELSKRIIEEIAPKYKDRNGGYTRITKLGPRKSDSAKMAIIELI